MKFTKVKCYNCKKKIRIIEHEIRPNEIIIGSEEGVLCVDDTWICNKCLEKQMKEGK